MTINFSQEAILEAIQSTKMQLSWAWRNMLESITEEAHDRWQDLSAFLLRQVCDLEKQAAEAESEKEFENIKAARERTA